MVIVAATSKPQVSSLAPVITNVSFLSSCIGSFTDITTRLDTFSHRRTIIGRSRSMPLWNVPQAFGDSAWWPREPTGSELLLMILISLNHGAMGIIPWDHNVGSTADQLESSAKFGTNLDILTPYLTYHHAVVGQQCLTNHP
jgi:hypothetical protein